MSTSNPEISNVEMENVSNIQYQLAGAEVRCQTCGGHLGDVFADGFLFPSTPAFATGKRCVYLTNDAAFIDLHTSSLTAFDGPIAVVCAGTA